MFLLGATLDHPPPLLLPLPPPPLAPAPFLAWPASTTGVDFVHSRAKLSSSLIGRPLDITEDLLVMQTCRYIKTIYFGNTVAAIAGRAVARSPLNSTLPSYRVNIIKIFPICARCNFDLETYPLPCCCQSRDDKRSSVPSRLSLLYKMSF